MPVARIGDVEYIGVLEIPSLGLSLPVQANWTEKGAGLSPGRWAGSAYDGDLVIAGAASGAQFGEIGLLRPGDQVTFTDAYGNRMAYHVQDQLNPPGDWFIDNGQWSGDLLLCTCATGGQYGVYVSCKRSS